MGERSETYLENRESGIDGRRHEVGADGTGKCLGSCHIGMGEELIDGMTLRKCPEDTNDSTVQDRHRMPPEEECHVQEKLQSIGAQSGLSHVLVHVR